MSPLRPSLRRHALARLVLVLILTVIAVIGARVWLAPVSTHSEEYHVFGTLVRVELRSRDAAAASLALQDIGRLLEHNHQSWHAWEPDSALSRINAELAQEQSVQAPADLADMIRYAKQGYERSQGLFNAAMGRLIGAWGFHDSHYPLQTPRPNERLVQQELANQPSMDDVDISAAGIVQSRNPAVALDLNGLAEGYAAMQIASLLRERAIRHGLIYIGGYVLVLGQAEGRPWRVGIRAPQGGLLGTVELSDGEALSSSGDYERFRPTATGREGHILDPRAGRPQRQAVAASVISDEPVMADMAATALMVAGPAEFVRISRSMGMGCALLLSRDGELLLTPAMQQRLAISLNTNSERLLDNGLADCRYAE